MTSVSYPTINRNYCLFDEGVNKRIQNGEKELEVIRQSLANPKSEDEVVEDLYIFFSRYAAVTMFFLIVTAAYLPSTKNFFCRMSEKSYICN